ncbi:MAG: Crp/Fnr family transcriptional regulator [Bacteroidetes bacterium]|nr:Crp/Fnr family transcriptional regulator [Bacteroidota bacterium]
MTKYEGILRNVPIFSSLNDETLLQIDQVCIKKNYQKGTIILFEHDEGNAFFFIVKGEVKISRESDDGREVILSLLQDADVFGEMSLLDGLPRSANVTAMEDTELYMIKREDFLELLNNHPDVSIALLEEITHRLREAGLRIKSLSLNDAEGKVAMVLLQIAEEKGKIKNGIVEIEKLPFQHDLANMAGTSRETISRTLHSFAKKGLVELEGSKLRIINYEQFKEIYT